MVLLVDQAHDVTVVEDCYALQPALECVVRWIAVKARVEDQAITHMCDITQRPSNERMDAIGRGGDQHACNTGIHLASRRRPRDRHGIGEVVGYATGHVVGAVLRLHLVDRLQWALGAQIGEHARGRRCLLCACCCCCCCWPKGKAES